LRRNSRQATAMSNAKWIEGLALMAYAGIVALLSAVG
jgi:hypothetical protein